MCSIAVHLLVAHTHARTTHENGQDDEKDMFQQDYMGIPREHVPMQCVAESIAPSKFMIVRYASSPRP